MGGDKLTVALPGLVVSAWLVAVTATCCGAFISSFAAVVHFASSAGTYTGSVADSARA